MKKYNDNHKSVCKNTMAIIKVCEKDTMAIIKVRAWKYYDNLKSMWKNTMTIIKVCVKIQWQS